MEDNVLQVNSLSMEEQLRKEEELLNTIKMEPILEKTVMEEEESVTKKRKMMKLTDYFLLVLIVILSIVFITVILTVR
jgi:hypothetical protein